MSYTEPYTIEAHFDAATLYVSGAMSITKVIAAMHRCDALPERVRSLRVDLRRVTAIEAGACDALAFTTRRWRDVRGGATRIDLPHREGPSQAA